MQWIYRLASPKSFYYIAKQLIPWVWLSAGLLLIYGLVDGLVFAPPDYQQGDAFRIIYVHVPSAALSLLIYSVMTISSVIFLVWRIKLADVISKVSAPIGAWFTACVLITGALWGKPMWGTYWIWDARLTSELILLFIYLGIILLRRAFGDNEQAGSKAAAILTLVGAVDLPIIHYSVDWWNTLHQKSTILSIAKPTIAPSMMWPLLALLLAFMLYYIGLMLMRARREILLREQKTRWVQELGK